ncbi:MAG: hypothetical protein IKN09_01915 [Clostridia bacterium]|nr:hypothetical protein [Clostridia bacterium]MBR4261043.1 hypothetical protein [Clostridia bacterium]
MLTEILKERVEEQRQLEAEAVERALKKESELKAKLQEVEENILVSVKEATPDAFSVPEDANPAIIFKHPADEAKESYTKTYEVYTGYCINSDKTHYHLNKKIGAFDLTLTFLFGVVDFGTMFSEDHPAINTGLKHENCELTIFLFAE